MADTIKVSGTSVTTAVAGAIAGVMRQHQAADVQAIGAKAVNQAAKAIAIARVYLQEDGLQIACVPRLVDVDVSGQVRTALRFSVLVLPEGDRRGTPPAEPPDPEPPPRDPEPEPPAPETPPRDPDAPPRDPEAPLADAP